MITAVLTRQMTQMTMITTHQKALTTPMILHKMRLPIAMITTTTIPIATLTIATTKAHQKAIKILTKMKQLNLIQMITTVLIRQMTQMTMITTHQKALTTPMILHKMRLPIAMITTTTIKILNRMKQLKKINLLLAQPLMLLSTIM